MNTVFWKKFSVCVDITSSNIFVDYWAKAANIVTVLAFLMAFYSFLFPEKISKFLDEIATSNQKLSDEIPYWLTLEAKHNDKIIDQLSLENSKHGYAVPLQNNANFTIKDIVVRVFSPDKNIIIERDSIVLTPFSGYIIYDVASREIFNEGMCICISGFSTRNNKALYEKRVFRPEGAVAIKEMMTIGYEFTDKGWPDGCSI